MEQGLSKRTRRIYLGVLTLIFLIAAPVMVLYASGYRLSSELEIIKTGGIHVSVPRSGASFYLDDSFEGRGSVFQRSFFIQNLTPERIYSVRIEREEYHPWRKQLKVFPTVISEGRALMLPVEPELTPILEAIPNASANGAATVTTSPNALYTEIISAFVATSTGVLAAPSGATTTIVYQNATTTVYERGNIGLWLDNAGLHAWWLDESDEFPYVFCNGSECAREILVWDRPQEVKHFDFLPSDNLFVILQRPDGIVVTELDTRTPQNTQPLYLKDGAQFRVIEGIIYVLDDDLLFRVDV